MKRIISWILAFTMIFMLTACGSDSGNKKENKDTITVTDMPGPAFVLGTYYMMHCMYPELVSTETMQQKTDEFYELFYGKTFTGEDIGYEF